MASSAEAQPTVTQQQPPAAAAAAAAQPKQPTVTVGQQKPTRVSLSYEEISKLFSLPIAEAASILGVCTSVLKRICRTHGIVRWPYRKLLSGKTGDEVYVGRERAKELLEISKVAKQRARTVYGPSVTSTSAFQGLAKPQQGNSKAGQFSTPAKQNAPSVSSVLAQASQTKGIPTYMDDFKYGFPSSGLSCETMKWWGTSSHTETTPAKDDNREALESTNEASKGMTDDDELDWGADEAEADGVVTTEPSAQLCSLRRKAVDDGRKLLTGEACRGQEFCRLNKRQRMVLVQVFGASLPEHLRSKLE